MMDPDEHRLFVAGVRSAVGAGSGAEVDAALESLGWADALALDERAAVGALFEAQGQAGTTSGALDLVLGSRLGVTAGAVLLPGFGRAVPPGRIDQAGLTVRGLGTARCLGDGSAQVVCAGDSGCSVAVVDLERLDRRQGSGLDPALGLVAVEGVLAEVEVRSLAEETWPAVVAGGRLAIAHELVGVSAAMLDLACDHARERVQFGVPIASFQAVRHRLADSLVAVESARGALDGAWAAGSAFDAAIAKAVAGRSARLVARHAQQVLAGIGFTLEHPFHRYARRVRLLDGLLGDARSLTREVGERLLADRSLPAILPL